MSGRNFRFVEDFSHHLIGQQPTEVLKLFNAKSMKEAMKKAMTAETDLQQLLAEASNYIGQLLIQQILEFAKQKEILDILPVECAFALRAYTRSDVCEVLNPMLRQGQDLQHYRQLCICMIKGLALLPPYPGKVFRGIGKVQVEDVCPMLVYGGLLIIFIVGSQGNSARNSLDMASIHINLCR